MPKSRLLTSDGIEIAVAEPTPDRSLRTDTKLIRRRSDEARAIQARADAELPSLVDRISAALDLSPPPTLTPGTLGTPGSRLRLSIDTPDVTWQAVDARTVYRPGPTVGAPSRVELGLPAGYLSFSLDFSDPNTCVGTYVAIVYVAVTDKMPTELDLSVLSADGLRTASAIRSGEKFSFVFEVTASTEILTLVFRTAQNATAPLTIYFVDLLKTA